MGCWTRKRLKYLHAEPPDCALWLNVIKLAAMSGRTTVLHVTVESYDQNVNKLLPIRLQWQQASSLEVQRENVLKLWRWRYTNKVSELTVSPQSWNRPKSKDFERDTGSRLFDGDETENSFKQAQERQRRHKTPQNGRCEANVFTEFPWWR